MRAVERQSVIRGMLESKGFVTYAQIAKKVKVSEATARRDAYELCRLGDAIRARGGVRSLSAPAPPSHPTFTERATVMAKEKDRIGRAAAALVKDGHTIIMDGGTTTHTLAPYIARRDIDLITNSITVADYLCDASSIEVIMTGGYLYRPSKVLLGPPAVRMLRQVAADVTFVSTGGVTLDGVGHSNSLIVETEKQMIARGARVVLLLDHSKFSSGSVLKVCAWSHITDVVTDRPVPEQFAEFFRKHDISVVIAK